MTDALEFIDSHAHVDGPEFDADRADVLARARAAGVRRMIVIGAVGDVASAERAVALAEADPEVWATIATHPHDVGRMTPAWWETHARLARHPRVVAIGETGLDYHYDHGPRDVQRAAFVRFVELAREVGKPVVCHVRDAHDDARAILRDTRAAELGVVIHCFTGTAEDAEAYAAMGCYVSFSGIVTYKNAQPIRDAVRRVPRDRLLVETDCPYLAPVPVRGRRNEPAFVVHTAAAVAAAAGMELAELARTTVANTCAIFGLPPAHRQP
jgi:TatD DNase family protein